jgi:hypothetical protein
MQCNIGKKDQALRILAGLAIIGAGALMGSWFALIGIVPIITGVLRFCPAYTLLQMNTLEK